MADAATAFVRELASPAIFHHSVRTYLYGRFLGQQVGMDGDYDDELFYLGAVLHDIGLTDRGDGEQRFELDGADLAANHLREQGLSEDRVEVVWDAIALHTSPDLAARKRPEIALVSVGAGADLGGGPAALPESFAELTGQQFPRLDVTTALYDAIVGQAKRRPEKAPPFTLPGALLQQETGVAWPTWSDLTTELGRSVG